MPRLKLDAPSTCAVVNGRIVRLTPTEYSVLEILLNAFPAEVPKEMLLGSVWGEYAVERKAYLAAYVQRLRRKLDIHPGDPSIVTRRRDTFDAGAYRLVLAGDDPG